MDTKKLNFDSKLIHSGHYKDEFGSAVTPIYQTSTFVFDNARQGADRFSGDEKGYIYTRIGNPTLNSLEEKLAELENGYRGVVLSSGMAAVTTVYMSLLNNGAHMIGTRAVYGPSRVVVESHFEKFGVEYDFVDTTDIRNIKNAIKPNTKLLYIETPENPTMGLTDLKEASEIARKHNILVAVDNTFCSPYLQKPLDLGADIVLHSLTKFINGHADIVGGALVAKDEEVYNMLRKTMVSMGCSMDPHQAYMVIRGVKTLSLRIDRAQDNALEIAKYLETHPKIEWIKYPGLKSFPQYELARKQMSGSGSMISFALKGGYEAGRILMDSVKLSTLAVSLGGVETLIQHPASMTHAAISKDKRIKAGITDGLVRYSVGIENVNDLIADLERALEKV